MKKTKHTEEKIIGAVKQMEAGRSAKEVARELGVTDQTLCNWKSKYVGLEVSDAKRLRKKRTCAEEDRGGSDAGPGCADDRHKKKRLELVSARRDVTLVMAEWRRSTPCSAGRIKNGRWTL